ncbi:hypothetical protein IE53DRAFT_283305 [Violaceomyces palustris]|uniref:Uncharacterized protein n=1 Tax=Violaceomyces palustris TaxID=1673888 RepID=A0ACD0NMB3_9BASI|nr:hypothetical protein IE53DRAFT_283305 [Violaceomyces palustris]
MIHLLIPQGPVPIILEHHERFYEHTHIPPGSPSSSSPSSSSSSIHTSSPVILTNELSFANKQSSSQRSDRLLRAVLLGHERGGTDSIDLSNRAPGNPILAALGSYTLSVSLPLSSNLNGGKLSLCLGPWSQESKSDSNPSEEMKEGKEEGERHAVQVLTSLVACS